MSDNESTMTAARLKEIRGEWNRRVMNGSLASMNWAVYGRELLLALEQQLAATQAAQNRFACTSETSVARGVALDQLSEGEIPESADDPCITNAGKYLAEQVAARREAENHRDRLAIRLSELPDTTRFQQLERQVEVAREALTAIRDEPAHLEHGGYSDSGKSGNTSSVGFYVRGIRNRATTALAQLDKGMATRGKR